MRTRERQRIYRRFMRGESIHMIASYYWQSIGKNDEFGDFAEKVEQAIRDTMNERKL